MIYRALICIRKVYDIKHSCDACSESKGSKYIILTIDNGSILRCNGYYCFDCISGQVCNYQQSGYNTVTYSFVAKLLKLNKVLKLNNNVDNAVNIITTNSKKIKTIKKAI